MRRKQNGWAQVVARWEASDESAMEFARRAGTTAATLYRWRRALKDGEGGKGPALARIVEVRSAAAVAIDDRFEVRLANGRSVGVPRCFDDDAFVRLLRVLEAAR